MGRIGILLVNLGTPARADPEAVRVFLQEFLSDPLVVDLPSWIWQPILRHMVLRSRPTRVAEAYASIWYTRPCGDVCPGVGCSPLECGTRRMCAALGDRLESEYRVSWAYRYGQPSIRDAFSEALESGVSRIYVVPLFPQRTCSTTGSIIRQTHRAARELGIESRVHLLAIDPADAAYAAGLANRARAALQGLDEPPQRLLISFHGIPIRYDRRERGRYVTDCRATAGALVRALDWPGDRYLLCYQSKFGPEPWLKPATAATIAALPSQGVRSLAVVTPGFLTEGLETLEEIGQQARELFLAAGGERFVYVPAVQDESAFMDGLARSIRQQTAPGPGGSGGAVREAE